MLAALDALPQPRLIANELVSDTGEVCAIGSVGAARGADMARIDPGERDEVAHAFGLAEAMVAEIAYVNDECGRHEETPEERFIRVRKWVVSQVRF